MKKIFIFLCLFGFGNGSVIVGMEKALKEPEDFKKVCTNIFAFLPMSDVLFTWKYLNKKFYALVGDLYYVQESQKGGFERELIEPYLSHSSSKNDEPLEKIINKDIQRFRRYEIFRRKTSVLLICFSAKQSRSKLNDADLAMISENFANDIYDLRLDWCYNLTDEGFKALTLPNLCYLFLNKVDNITDQALKYIGKQFNLRFLSFLGNENITGKGVKELANLNNLQELILDGCPNVTDDGVAALIKCKELRKLVLLYCTKITDEGVEPLMLLPKLKLIDLLSTGVSEEMKEKFRKKNIKVV